MQRNSRDPDAIRQIRDAAEPRSGACVRVHSAMRRVVAHRLGLLSYAKGQAAQRALAARRRAGTAPDTLLLLEHSPVFTLGRLQESRENVRASDAEIMARGAEVVQSDRGGNVTFHGPGQLVAYPILDLTGYRRNLRWYVSALEDAMIDTAAAYGVEARRGATGETGVWVADRKLGALGVRVARWISCHGIALNVDVDLGFFDMIVPCGLHDAPTVTSLARELAPAPPVRVPEVGAHFVAAFARRFDCEVEEEPVPSFLAEAMEEAEVSGSRGVGGVL